MIFPRLPTERELADAFAAFIEYQNQHPPSDEWLAAAGIKQNQQMHEPEAAVEAIKTLHRKRTGKKLTLRDKRLLARALVLNVIQPMLTFDEPSSKKRGRPSPINRASREHRRRFKGIYHRLVRLPENRKKAKASIRFNREESVQIIAGILVQIGTESRAVDVVRALDNTWMRISLPTIYRHFEEAKRLAIRKR